LQRNGFRPCIFHRSNQCFAVRAMGVIGEDCIDAAFARLSTVLRPIPRLPPVTIAIFFGEIASLSVGILGSIWVVSRSSSRS
jgi:hypothetical protein